MAKSKKVFSESSEYSDCEDIVAGASVVHRDLSRRYKITEMGKLGEELALMFAGISEAEVNDVYFDFAANCGSAQVEISIRGLRKPTPEELEQAKKELALASKREAKDRLARDKAVLAAIRLRNPALFKQEK